MATLGPEDYSTSLLTWTFFMPSRKGLEARPGHTQHPIRGGGEPEGPCS